MSSAIDPLAPIQSSVLVTVKTYPTPSIRHIETVCVAGVRLDTPKPEWVRLYPIPFRTQSFDYEFAKYQIIDVPISPRGSKDPRPESYQPNNQAIVLGSKLDTKRKWATRKELLGNLIGERTTCQMIAMNKAVRMNEPAESLALVKPVNPRLTIEEGKGWTDKQQAKVDRAAEPDLFGGPEVKTPLEPMPLQIKVAYECLADGCRGHRQTIIDWEVGSAAYWWGKRYGDEGLGDRLLEKWSSMILGDNDTHFFIGNQHQYRHSFSILGVWYPKL